MKRLALMLLMTLWPLTASAVGVDADQLPDPAQEAQARTIMKDLRCLVCQNQSIEDSNATLARDLRTVVRQRVAAGDDADTIKQYLVDRYGEWVLLDPRFEPLTAILWAAPALIVFGGGLMALRYIRRNRDRVEIDDGSDDDVTPA